MKVSWEVQGLEGIFFHAFTILSVQIWSNIPLLYREPNNADNKYIKEEITALELISDFTVN